MGHIISTSRAVNALAGSVDAAIASGHTVEVVEGDGFTADRMAELVRDCDALLVGMEPVTREVIRSSPRLRIVARPGVGYDNVDVAAATEASVLVTITPNANTDSVADHAIALILACTRNVVAGDGAVKDGGWPRLVGIELRGRTLGLIGFGSVGKAVAERGRAFGLRVLASDPFAEPTPDAGQDVELVSLDELTAEADIISLHAALTSETLQMVNREFLRHVRRGVILVNTARGQLIDEEALSDALHRGVVACAGLDVFAQEPPASSPLLRAKHVVLTPHIAAYTGASLRRMAEMAVGSVVDALAGRTPIGVVNPAALQDERYTH